MHLLRAFGGLIFIFFAWQLSGQDEQLRSNKPSFSHQYRHLDQDHYQFIDTSFNSLKWYRKLNTTEADDFGELPILNMGGARNRIILPQTTSSPWQLISMGPHQNYFTDPYSMPLYEAKSPLTEARYISGYGRGQLFSIYHTQNVNKRWNFYLRYRRLNSLSAYVNDQNTLGAFEANTHYQSKNGRYDLVLMAASEQHDMQESGGLANVQDFTDGDDEARDLMDMNLGGTNADQRLLRKRQYFLRHRYQIVPPEKPKLDTAGNQISPGNGTSWLIGHEFHYQRNSVLYASANGEFYDNYFFQDVPYRDSLAVHSYDNSFFFEINNPDSSYIPELKTGVRNQSYRYVNEYFDMAGSNWGVFGEISGKLGPRIDYRGQADIVLAGERNGTFAVNGGLNYQLAERWRLSANMEYGLRYPEIFDLFYISNNFIWRNEFSPMGIQRTSGALHWPGGQLSVENFNAANWIYYDSDARPATADDPVSYLNTEIKHSFAFWGFLHSDHRVAYQQNLAGGEFLPLPDLVARNSLYFQFKLFGDALNCLIGAENTYFSSFNSPSYSPGTGRFYLAEDRRPIGDFPYVDFFAQFKVLKATVFVKVQNLTQGFTPYEYFAAPAYPLNDRIVRLGASWRFFE